MTIAIESRKRTEVLMRLAGLEQSEEIFQITNRYSELLKGYRHAYKAQLSPGHDLTIQVHPHDSNSRRRFMRLEWNPHKSIRGGDSLRRVLFYLDECIPDFDPVTVVTEASITRIDLTFDLFRIPVDAVLAFTVLRKPVSGRFHELRHEYGPEGKLNSMFLGRYDADRYLLIYDKNAEEKNRQIRGITGIARPHSPAYRPASRTRFELRLKDAGTYAEFLDSSNPYEHYTIRTHRAAQDYRRDPHWLHFMDSCQLRGAQASLSLFENRRIRTQYRDALRACEPPDWWNPSLLWEEAKNAFRRILLPDANPINGQTGD